MAKPHRNATTACHFLVIVHPNGSLLSTTYMICMGEIHNRCVKLTVKSIAVMDFICASFLLLLSSSVDFIFSFLVLVLMDKTNNDQYITDEKETEGYG